jgi:hypothetical protein
VPDRDRPDPPPSITDRPRTSSDEREAIASARHHDPGALERRFQGSSPLHREAMLQMVARHLQDGDPRLREACAWILHVLRPTDGELSEVATRALLTLAQDQDDDVRDWALFALGRGGTVPTDTPEIRQAMLDNLEHPNPRVQREAIEGLAQLGDPDALVTALDRYDVDPETVEAAARSGDPLFHPYLLQLRDRGWTTTASGEPSILLDEALGRALEACRPRR